MGGWARAFIAEGYRVIGFDIQANLADVYPGEFHCADVRELARDVEDSPSMWRDVFAGAAVIVASPPCEEFARHQMPWTRRRNPPPPDLSIVEACKRIARAAGKPMVMENVRKAQDWLGRAAWHCGGFYLWGDVPAIMPKLEWGPDKGLAPEGTYRQKQTMSSTWRLERAMVPFELAQWIAHCFK